MAPAVIDRSDHGAINSIGEVLASSTPLFAFEFDRVFGLVAPMSTIGINMLHQAKNRLDGKTYGSILLSQESFIANSNLPIPDPKKFFASLQNCFVRASFKCRENDSDVTKNGTHQTMILESDLQQFFKSLFNKGNFISDPFFHFPYPSLLVTSANTSGTPVITTIEEMTSFAREKEIPMIVTTGHSGKSKGSFPIIDFSTTPFNIARPGIRGQELLDIAKSLFEN